MKNSNSGVWAVGDYEFKGEQKARFLARCPNATHILVDYSGARNRIRKQTLIDNNATLCAIIGGTTNQFTIAGVLIND